MTPAILARISVSFGKREKSMRMLGREQAGVVGSRSGATKSYVAEASACLRNAASSCS